MLTVQNYWQGSLMDMVLRGMVRVTTGHPSYGAPVVKQGMHFRNVMKMTMYICKANRQAEGQGYSHTVY